MILRRQKTIQTLPLMTMGAATRNRFKWMEEEVGIAEGKQDLGLRSVPTASKALGVMDQYFYYITILKGEKRR